jgi:hypothetical protein
MTWLAGVIALGGAPAAEASEGAASYYFAGAFGSFLVAVPPEPGLSDFTNTNRLNRDWGQLAMSWRF